MVERIDRALRQLNDVVAEIVREHGEVGARAVRRAVTQALLTSNPATPASEGSLHTPEDRSRYSEIVGDSPAMLSMMAVLDRVSSADLSVLIQGESGTGKELVARAIHENSPRRKQAFVTENCAAIPETLQESELFGYKRGAFTGADRERKGLFEVADGGTLFLDEVGDMSPSMQKKLLRALQDGEIRAVGGTRSVKVDVRVVSASNRGLLDMVKNGTFREDLYYRLNGITVELPPLRDRTEDIPLLVDVFLVRAAAELGRAMPTIVPEALDALASYRWPGNVRQLDNEIRRCLALLGDETVIRVEHFSPDILEP